MAGYGYPLRNPLPYGFIGSLRPGTDPGIDSDGRTRPVSSYLGDGNGESYVMTVETTVQRVPPMAAPTGSYGIDRDRPPIVDEFLKKIQTQVSQPAWHPTMSVSPFGVPHPAPMVQFGTAREFTNGIPRPPITESGFIEQGRMTATPIDKTPTLPRFNTRISRAMNDISEATGLLKELSRPMAPTTDTVTAPLNPVSLTGAANKGSAPETIDSREAMRRYKNVIVSREPSGKEGSALMMDSKTAKEKYGGVFV
ncbi:hypothetical protein MLD38_040476 [Melastoma candidum]|nr:hypothetical protein MLD38_040476 [Melastoma candidum]